MISNFTPVVTYSQISLLEEPLKVANIPCSGACCSLKQRRRDIFSALKSAFDCMCSIHMPQSQRVSKAENISKKRAPLGKHLMGLRK